MSFRKIQSAIVDPQMSFRKCRVTIFSSCLGYKVHSLLSQRYGETQRAMTSI
ncbi:unnamed protein product [Meloidogyne enterolobii]|uniref:Uncharacterized protein n=1 Tax=Meloidogyne enterolobii TaxID=390850 RepID=A0ACB0Z6I6_MELEN